MAKIIIEEIDGRQKARFYCPGCLVMHTVDIDTPQEGIGGWTYHGTPDMPTINPVMEFPNCRPWVKGGKICFAHGTGHQFAGQLVDMVDVEA